MHVGQPGHAVGPLPRPARVVPEHEGVLAVRLLDRLLRLALAHRLLLGRSREKPAPGVPVTDPHEQGIRIRDENRVHMARRHAARDLRAVDHDHVGLHFVDIFLGDEIGPVPVRVGDVLPSRLVLQVLGYRHQRQAVPLGLLHPDDRPHHAVGEDGMGVQIDAERPVAVDVGKLDRAFLGDGGHSRGKRGEGQHLHPNGQSILHGGLLSGYGVPGQRSGE